MSDQAYFAGTPSGSILEVVYYSDMVTKAQLWLRFPIKISIGKLYMYIFMKVIFKTNLFIWFAHFQIQQIKSYSWFIFPMFDSNLVQNDFKKGTGGSIWFSHFPTQGQSSSWFIFPMFDSDIVQKRLLIANPREYAFMFNE
jgi:hypothetical protein